MSNGQVLQVIAILVSLEAMGMMLGFFLSRIVHKALIEFTEEMYRNEEKHNRSLFEEVKRLGDLNLEYERRIKKMTLNEYLDSHTVNEILKEESK
jgi:hypothetical protein